MMLLNPFTFGAAAINANVQMANGVSSATLPSHAAGDYIFAFAYRDGNNNAPALPSGWTALSPTGLVGSNTNSALLCYKVAASGAETATGFTNATGLVVAVVKQAGAGPLGLGADSDVLYGVPTSAVITIPAMTLSNGNGKSVVLVMGGQRDVTGTFNSSISGMTLGTFGQPGSNNIVGGFYTTTGVTSFGSRTLSLVSGSTTGYALSTVEITNAA